MDKVLKRIQRNKKARQKQKEKKQRYEQLRGIETRRQLEKKEKKVRTIIPVPDTQAELLDDIFKEPEEVVEKKQKKENHVPIEGFTVLGGDTFDKKTKVIVNINIILV